ncbi:MAG: hypothetical protein GX930_06615 [Clostridia bacterium]|nr:hypothetical protein [Clostridia bacterium]
MKEAVSKVLDIFRPALQADHADIVLDHIDGCSVYLKLVIAPETCLDCILPSSQLIQVLTDAITDETGTDVVVYLEDPRVQS